MSKPAPACDCESCAEMRAYRAEYPKMRVTALEQIHNLGVAQRELNAAILASPPMAWLARWVERHPRQSVAVGSVLCLALLAIFIFVEPVAPHR